MAQEQDETGKKCVFYVSFWDGILGYLLTDLDLGLRTMGIKPWVAAGRV